jgi:hypothetical protein
MASELIVQTLKGPTTGANANKVIIPSGQELSIADGLPTGSFPAGSIVQTVHDTLAQSTSHNTTTFASVGLDASITLTDATSKVLCTVSFNGYNGTSNRSYFIRIRNLTTETTVVERDCLNTNSVAVYPGYLMGFDSPNTTATQSYAVQIATDGVGTAYISQGNRVCTLMLQEVTY